MFSVQVPDPHWYSINSFLKISLRSKRFRGVWEQRKTEERDFRCFVCAENGARTKKKKEGGGRGEGRKEVSFLPSLPSPPSFTRSIFRAVIFCSRTPQKRLLRRLSKNFNGYTFENCTSTSIRKVTKRQVHKMHVFKMFITAVCFIFLNKRALLNVNVHKEYYNKIDE